MRIVFLGTSSLADASPRGRWLPIARELTRHGHEVHLLLLHPTFDRLTEKRLQVDGVHVAYVSQMHVYGLPGQRRYFGPLRLSAVGLRASIALAAAAWRLQPDVIHVCKPQPINGLAGLIASRRGAQLNLDCDDHEAEANRFGGRWQRWLMRWWEDDLPQRMRAVSVNTRALHQRCITLGVAPQRLYHVPNGVSAAQFQRPTESAICALRHALEAEGHPTVAYVGTLSKVAHGTGLLLDAFVHLLRALPQARLLMVGDGDDRAALQAQAAQLGVDAAIRWVGRVPYEQAPLYFCAADCSVDPVYDTAAARARSPLKIVESMALGVPVVTGEVGDRREMLADGAAGVLVQAGDAEALARGLEHVLVDSGQRARWALDARQQAEAYRWERLTNRWQRMYA